MTRTTLKPGDRIVVTGELARDSAMRLLIQNVRRPSDGWQWQGKVE
jgi:thiamine monophosphate kinase